MRKVTNKVGVVLAVMAVITGCQMVVSEDDAEPTQDSVPTSTTPTDESTFGTNSVSGSVGIS